jgi:hypothetical protein
MPRRISAPIHRTWPRLSRVLFCIGVSLWCLDACAKEEKWLQVNTPEFTLVTSLNEKEAVTWAAEFSQYVAALRDLFHFKRPLPPLTIVVFARDRAFEEYRPLNEEKKPEQVAGFFWRDQSWAVAGLAGANATEETRRTIFHEGVHWFLSAFDRPNPIWVEEGLAEVFSTFSVTKTKAEWGRAIPEHVTLLSEERQLRVDQLLAVGRSELFRDDSLHTGIVYAQSWATVHFLLYGDSKEIPRNALFDFLKLSQTETSMETAFRKAFQSNYPTFDRLLNSYLHGGRYYIRSTALAALVPMKAEPAPPLEVAQALGRLAFAARRWEKAATFARNTVQLAPEDPRGYVLLGMTQKALGDEAGATTAFATAAAKGSQDFRPYFELAFATQRGATDDTGEASGLKPEDARAMVENYERAILLSPRFVTSYQNLAGVIGLAEPMPHDRKFLELGEKIYPHDGVIRVGLAILTERSGDRAAARKLVDEIEQDTEQPARVRAYARKYAEGWAEQEVAAHLDTLMEEKKYAAALDYLEQQSKEASMHLRTNLANLRPQIKGALRSEEIAEAFDNRRWDDARRLLNDTIASPDLPILLRRQAQRSLDELNRGKER